MSRLPREILRIGDMTPFDEGHDIEFCILTPQTVHVPGDERSRTNPGHGYPAHDLNLWRLEAFEDQQHWEAEIKKRTLAKESFVPFRMVRPEVSVTTEVEIDLID